MGASTSGGLQGVRESAGKRAGEHTVSGRYHRLPRKLCDDYALEQHVLGTGYNGAVTSAIKKVNGRKYAVKCFKFTGVTDRQKEQLESECEIFLCMDHPHVARLVDVYESEKKLDLVMECCSGGELFKRVRERKRFTEEDARDASWQMLLAISYLQSHKVVHRDIKLENWLYESEGSDHLKLIDFGFSKYWQNNTKMAAACGTLAYVAPEVLDQSYTSQCDMWSFGVTVFIVLFGHMPFRGTKDEQRAAISQGKYVRKDQYWNRVSADAQDFVTKLLVVDPRQRLTSKQALEHDWIKKRDEIERSRQLADHSTANALISFAQTSQFRRAAMHMMAWSLTNEERAQVRRAFIDMDINRTGAITASEFKQVLEDRFRISGDQVKEAFNALDANNQDEIQYSEFLAAMVSTQIQLHDELLQAAFNRFDKDNTGYISPDNLREVLGDRCSPDLVEAMIRDVDSKGDHQISFKEFIAYLRDDNARTEHQEAALLLIDQEMSPRKLNREGSQPAELKREGSQRAEILCGNGCELQ